MTDDDGIPDDSVVATALRLLPVPDHGPDFWSQLEAVVQAEPDPEVIEPALAVGPPRQPLVASPPLVVERTALAPRPPQAATDHALQLVPPSLRSRSNLVLAAIGAAAAVVVVVAAATLIGQRSSSVVADSSGSDGAAATVTTADTAARDDAATQVVLDFVGAMGQGSSAAAWATLAPASRAHFGSSSAFAQQLGDTSAYATWSGSSADDAQVLAVPSDAGDVLVVTLVGSDEQDGATRRWAVAFPVRIVEGTPQVEAYAFAGEVDMVVPQQAAGGAMPVVATDDTLVVNVPRDVAAPTISLDGGAGMVCGEADGTKLSEPDESPGQQCSYQPAEALPEGRHVLTVAFLSPDGAAVAAESVLFRAE